MSRTWMYRVRRGDNCKQDNKVRHLINDLSVSLMFQYPHPPWVQTCSFSTDCWMIYWTNGEILWRNNWFWWTLAVIKFVVALYRRMRTVLGFNYIDQEAIRCPFRDSAPLSRSITTLPFVGTRLSNASQGDFIVVSLCNYPAFKIRRAIQEFLVCTSRIVGFMVYSTVLFVILLTT